MADNIDGSASPTVETPSPVTGANAEVTGRENVGVNQAVSRMLKSEQAREANAQAGSVPPVEETTTTPSAEESAPDSSAAEEAPAEAPAEVEAEPTDALSNDGGPIDPKIQELVNKRIEKRVSKEVAKRKALESQLNELKVQMQAQAAQPPAQPQTVVPLPKDAPPLANIEDANGLNQVKEDAFKAIDAAQEQLDSGVEEFQMEGKTYKWKEVIRNANRTLQRDIPARATFLQQRQQVQQNAFQQFPFLRDKSSPDYVAAQSAYQAMPWLKNLPNADWIIGVQIEGLKALQARQQAAERKPKPAAKTPNPPSSQTAVSTNGTTERVSMGTRNQQEISAIRNQQSRKGGVSANEAIAALTKLEQLKHR